ncbi:7-carboxy-7-deazaguanine synthase QueE [Corallincola platygyrae]|uniref:7-carboxy-7-deazaguanine synthase n=1 Tax=Corallincola platygyrae TaxID=1193278 RepID=A0ABW4XKE4_9GAMM
MQQLAYPVNEVFETIQGEGVYTGVPAVFVRLQGCPVGCSWCDTKQTWEQEPENEISIKDLSAKSAEAPTWSYLTAKQLLDLCQSQGYVAKHIVITGGEPCIHDLLPLTDAFISEGYSVQIETSGTFEIKAAAACWVTVSPKVDMRGGYDVLESALQRADEIKHPIAKQSHIDDLDRLLEPLSETGELADKTICLQPISQLPRATELAIKTCIQRNWRLSIQAHKYLNIE